VKGIFRVAILLLALAAVGSAADAQIDSCSTGAFDQVITVDWALDNTPDSSGSTCTYCANGDVVSGAATYAAAGTVTLRNFTAEMSSTVSVIAGTGVVIEADTSIDGAFTVSIEPNCGV
jgi:hypothetical protein